ncbi:hypothetical protein FNF27_00980 [Cafeteria roenbergensis]|uniref:EF-hand domain-containing protein n=1 Tax=Cafeteria roenbergensis TaxID=33653 RepID=A0A5A8DTN8_CAFRO|nr:hypothetical protein FNF29_01226 [Cafeteria roenbergensis]KAA0168539.1 hypothetical protein FNF31_00419 [Cafeteria roenbergensis]KAA0171176.1 hypothetical protein FNF28_00942 [Cafeteria roenbergensis]KAA0177809.1 hypothetical protein FNF27_00980 [Cafeteria roenbergensis]|eukprot:KAA0156434.1 hypothetical protein FNF29_01226 [Cafeteria roenbergensis]
MEGGLAAAAGAEGPDQALRHRIRVAFDLFDDAANGTVPSEEVPTILRYLGIFPPEAEIPDIMDGMHEEEPTKYVTYERFEARALEMMREGKYAPDSEETILAAFKVFDPEDTGEIDAERLQQMLLEDGDSGRGYQDKEMEAFMSIARDPGRATIAYEDYVAKLMASIEQAQAH